MTKLCAEAVLSLTIVCRLFAAETTAEQWVRQQVKAGRDADLLTRFPTDRSARILSAGFLEAMLGANSGFVNRKGICILHAIVREALDLERLDATADIVLTGLEFQGPVDLSGAHFHRFLIIRDSVFKQKLDGYLLVVDGDLSLSGIRGTNGQPDHFSRFEKPVDLHYAVVGGTLAAHRAHFEDNVNFGGIRVGGRGYFQNSEFGGNVDFTLASFTRDVEFAGARFVKPGGQLNFNSVRSDYVFNMDGTIFAPRAKTILSNAKLARVQLKNVNLSAGTVEMNGLAATEIDLENVKWPRRDQFECDSVTYDRIRVRTGAKSTLGQWPESSQYTTSTYSALAKYLDEQGDASAASDIRVAQKEREGASMSGLHWLWNRLLLITCAYGERPWYAFAWIGGVVTIGCMVFRAKNLMERTEPNKPEPAYNAFWYSLGLFLPVIDIGMIKSWRPPKSRPFAWQYAQAHVLLGWVFVPIALASITGILK